MNPGRVKVVKGKVAKEFTLLSGELTSKQNLIFSPLMRRGSITPSTFGFQLNECLLKSVLHQSLELQMHGRRRGTRYINM